MDTSKAFVAVELDESSVMVLARCVQVLRQECPKVRWSRPEQLHLTLKFIGDIDNRQLPTLCQTLREVCSVVEPFAIELRGLGTFPKHKPPRVVWAGVIDPTEQLRKLAEQIDERMGQLGIARENRQFTPHLTLGRVTRAADSERLQAALAEAAPRIAGRCEVEELALLASLKEGGQVEYDAIDRAPLKY